MGLPVVLVVLFLASAEAGRWTYVDIGYNYKYGYNEAVGPIHKTFIRGEVKCCQSVELYLRPESNWNNYILWQIYYYNSYTALLDKGTYKTWKYGKILDCNSWKPFWFKFESGTFSMGFGLEPGTNQYLISALGKTYSINQVLMATRASTITGQWRWLWDEPPLFNAPEADGNQVIEVSENLQVGSTVFTPGGSDPEGDTITWSMVENTGTFTFSSGKAVLSKALDYETKKSYFLVFQASDGRHNVKNGLLVRVKNVNDVTPNVVRYTLYIPEELAVGTDIGKCVDVFHDEEDDSLTVYHGGTNYQYLTLNTKTYVMSMRQVIDLETQSVSLTGIYVLALDRAYKYDYIWLRVYVYDINDNHPVFTKMYYETTITEGTKSGVAVITVGANDRDVSNGGLTTSIISENGATSGFSFSLDHFNLKTATTIDYESLSASDFEYILVLKVVDKPPNGDPLSSTTVVRVKVTPVNEAAPKWTGSGSYSVSVAEDTPTATVIATVAATDADLGTDGDITYSIQSVSPCKIPAMWYQGK